MVFEKRRGFEKDGVLKKMRFLKGRGFEKTGF